MRAIVTLADLQLLNVAEASAIDEDVMDARGYEWVTDRSRLQDLGFSQYQCRVPGLLIPIHGVAPDAGIVWWQFRPTNPRIKDGKTTKYESPAGLSIRLDCNPLMRRFLDDPSVPLYVTEGVKKGDAAASAGLLCVALAGVDGWSGGAKSDWDHVALKGRKVFVAYDSDVMSKDTVRGALDRLTTFLALRGAVVNWIVLPSSDRMVLATGNEIKMGLDDWFADGGSVDGLLERALVPRLSVVVNGELWPETQRAIAGLQVRNDPPWLYCLGERSLVEAVGRGTLEVSKERLTVLGSRHLRFVKRTEKGEVNADPKPAIVSNVLSSWDEWPFPSLQRVTGTPTFAPDGSLRTEPGYHASSRTLYVPDEGLTIRPVPARPTRRDVKRAVSLIVDDLFGDFPFRGEADLAHAVAMTLEPFLRDLIRGVTPLYVPTAPTQGTGKTLLVRSALGPAFGTVEGGISEPHSDEELEKRITAAMLAGQPFFFIDNVTQLIKWQSMSAALTKANWEGRKLGVSEVVNVPNRMLWVLTGNNPQFTDDMARRVVLIRMDTGQERPQDRGGFRHSLPAWAQVDGRADLVWACCTLIQNWIAEGKPPPEESVPHFGSFSAWRRVLGGVLHSSGVPGFLSNLGSSLGSNEEAEGFAFLLRGIHSAQGGKPFTAGDLLQTVLDNDEVAAIVDPGGRRTSAHGLRTALGRYLASRTDRVAGGLKLEASNKPTRTGAKQYRVRKVGDGAHG
jgi:hypothetical protein